MPLRSAQALALPLLLALAAVRASCPNLCTGHGSCGAKDACECDRGFAGADCSQRRCPVGPAIADVAAGDLNHDGLTQHGAYATVSWAHVQQPEVALSTVAPASADASGLDNSGATVAASLPEAHGYAECSGKGLCDRRSGLCECFRGFSGHACQRTDCPRACSAHGVCRTVADVARLAANRKRLGFHNGGVEDVAGVSTAVPAYRLWDAQVFRQCVCDPGFTGADCSERLCPRGPDPMAGQTRHCGDQGCLSEIQAFSLTADRATTFRLGFSLWSGQERHALVTLATDAAEGQPASVNAAKIKAAFLRDITDHLFDDITVAGTGTAGSQQDFSITFANNPGNHPQLTLLPVDGPGSVVAGSLTTVRDGTQEEIECSGRGRCDRTTGICACFHGYGREDCGRQVDLTVSARQREAARAARTRRELRLLEDDIDQAQDDELRRLHLQIRRMQHPSGTSES